MNNFWNDLLEKYDNYIDKREFGVYTDITYFSRAYLLGQKNSSFSLATVSLPNEVNLDESDNKIVKILSKDARKSIVDISQEIKITPKTIIKKLKRLEKEKIILGYRTCLLYTSPSPRDRS